MMTKKLAALVLGLAALVLNPFFACSALAPGFELGADEMRAAVEGTWTITVPGNGVDAPAVEFTVVIAQRASVARLDDHSLVAPAAACGSRSFVKTAAACLDSTKMPLDVQIVKGPSTKPASGELVVYGTSFDNGRLDLTLAANEMRAMVNAQGTARDARLIVDGSERDVELVRVAPAAPTVAPKT